MNFNNQEKIILSFHIFLGVGFIISAILCHNIFPDGLIDWIFLFIGILCFNLDLVFMKTFYYETNNPNVKSR